MAKKVMPEYKSLANYRSNKPKVGTKEYVDYIYSNYGLAKNIKYDMMSEEDKKEQRKMEKGNPKYAQSYTDYLNRMKTFNNAIKTLQKSRDFLKASKEEKEAMLEASAPGLAGNMQMSLIAYESREEDIVSGKYEMTKLDIYRDNYVTALKNSQDVLHLPDYIIKQIEDIPTADLDYVMNELLDELPDWYGINGSVLVSNAKSEFTIKLVNALDYYRTQLASGE